MLAFLLLLVCSSPSGDDDCGFVKVAELSPMECAQAGMVIAAQYANEHPKESVKGYRCVVVVTPEKDA